MKKTHLNTLFQAFAYTASTLFLLSCGASGSLPVSGEAGRSSTVAGVNYSGEEQDFSEDRMVIYNAWLDLVVLEPENAEEPLKNIASQQGGYLQKSGTEEVVLRVKSQNLEKTLAAIEQLGKVRNKRISGTDVSEEYLDNNIRLENAEKLRLRYLALLAKAEKVEEMLNIERELERLNTRIDQYKGRKQYLENQSELATISINLIKKVKAGPVGVLFVGLYKGIRWLFVWK